LLKFKNSTKLRAGFFWLKKFTGQVQKIHQDVWILARWVDAS